ncbi:putative metal-dependent hydrolase YfiT [mine drainage metagenome]|uniref:Putative metal-dependent hydrolase YfiT n=1 Tax=mine drainage metagenome TaxID=410659 RepID=A0A1J5Q8F8_9ZZZZ
MKSDLPTYAKQYEEATRRFEALVDNLSQTQLDLKHPDGWSPRQIIHHVADSETQSYARIRRLVAEPLGSIIQSYDEEAWAKNPTLGYEDSDVTNSIAVFKAVRASTLDLIKRLSPSDLERYGEHSDSGQYTLVQWLESYVGHPNEHADQLERALQQRL